MNTIDRRQYKRSKSPNLLPVIDTNAKKQLGMLVDLSLGGALVMTMESVPVDSIYQLQVILPKPMYGSNIIEFAAETAWADLPGQQGTCWAGFHIIDIADLHRDRIQVLVDLWGLADIDSPEQPRSTG